MRPRHALLIALMLTWGLFSALLVNAQETRYTVRPGDTLASIASANRISPALLAQRNAITYAAGLRTGQVLFIPDANFVATSHTVQPGESLAVIAQLYGTTVAELQSLNALGGPRIVPGQVLQLPGSAANLGQGGGVIVVTATPSPMPAGQGGGFVPVNPSMPSAPLVHIVEVGETLQIIAARYGTTWQALAQANNLQNPNFLPAGSSLIIPNSAGQGGGAVGGPTTGQVVGANTISAFYVVRVGDTLSQIAERFGTTVAAIQRANGLTNTVIFPDSTLLIPFNLGVGGPVVTLPTVVAPSGFPFANGTIRGGRYTVAQGDTLFGIANRFNVDAWNVARANRITNLNHIFSGQILLIPGR